MKIPQLEKNIPEYASFFKQVRTNKGLKLEDIAEKIGCSSMALSFWERGKRDIKFSLLEKWVDALGFKLVLDFKDKY